MDEIEDSPVSRKVLDGSHELRMRKQEWTSWKIEGSSVHVPLESSSMTSLKLEALNPCSITFTFREEELCFSSFLQIFQYKLMWTNLASTPLKEVRR
ncbi:hypothetical protein TorRG33x02_187970 [Trema orientale]|uniref:Uncharacterized protein n=1 Tax=Trema orientale TaxID=63057 RepID=A0A2P5EIL5_TREOI|nr:hypothetical protein TorRG33x02_187970 [Trema orientale]